MAAVLLLLGLSFPALPQAVLPATQPATEKSANSTSQQTVVSADSLLPELPPLPHGKATLVGGSIARLDRVRDQLTVQVFGGQDMKILFDERTRVYRDGTHASQRDLEPGQKVYVETTLDGSKIFARNIRVITHSSLGESQGQVVDYNRQSGELLLRDQLAPEPLKLRVLPSTIISREGQSGPGEIVPGALISVEFQPGDHGRRDARRISILATPGTSFTFAGQVAYLDMHSGTLVLIDPRDNKRYEISFDPDRTAVPASLREGSEVTVSASFDGSRYVASTIAAVHSPQTQ